MTHSANEVMVLAAKAARGGGAPPAQAAQFGSAAVLHLVTGRAVDDLDEALAALPNGPILSYPLGIAQIAEQAVKGIARGIMEGGDTSLARSYVESMPCSARLDADGTLTMEVGKPALRRNIMRISLSHDTYIRWSAFAAALLVAESDASRQSGAGAGVSNDND
ncbi:hypothetical protein [Sulfitobacter guttiformis]|uniref:Uncharacterized protein n=1 Tax=Sulfitobacter guttiformis TaxID=74349 RepID=A0A420DPD3_9RHOB|nr:hypothetical protein [Sulfitobacter guttiformis]RKE96105.1 hypothetical protein C8N30_0656 [Sulfitobacter guttiformis]